MDEIFQAATQKKSFEIFYLMNAVILTSNSQIFSCEDLQIATLHRLECELYAKNSPKEEQKHCNGNSKPKTSTDHFLSPGNPYEKPASQACVTYSTCIATLSVLYLHTLLLPGMTLSEQYVCFAYSASTCNETHKVLHLYSVSTCK